MTPMPEFVNIAAYKFVDLDRLAERKADLLPFCQQLDLKGTILLSNEGINMFLAGARESIDSFLKRMREQTEFSDLEVKESLSDHQPFSRMLVRLKKEIISMGVPAIKPKVKTSPKLKAQELKQWLDDGKSVTLLDVRNDYEVEVGTFRNAVPVGVDHFRNFPKAIETLPESMKQQPLVMFCTGGIRCEKAGPLMEEQGFQEVYQLDGGILKYFEECGDAHYDGDCFVFDKRVAVDAKLAETEIEQCYGCQAVLTLEEQRSPQYQPPHLCPHCFETPDEKQRKLLDLRDQRLTALTTPLPGSIPYDNVRPMNVPLACDHFQVIDLLCEMHPHAGRDYWIGECEKKLIHHKEKPLTQNTVVRAGWRIDHLIPQMVEPEVNCDVKFLFEDDSLIAVNKPAPLPMHPCGRFNRNSLKYFISQVYTGEQIRILHRLDANTTGVVVLARKRAVAKQIHRQFQEGTIQKTYLAKVTGHPIEDSFTCEAAIGDSPDVAGSRNLDPNGLPATTHFLVIDRLEDGTSLVKCFPKTGRTNQIRIHLSSLGFPIIGDPIYSVSPTRSTKQSLSVDDAPMCLHAFEIELIHPTSNTPLKIQAPTPCWWPSTELVP